MSHWLYHIISSSISWIFPVEIWLCEKIAHGSIEIGVADKSNVCVVFMDPKTHDVEIGVKNDLVGVKSWKSTFTLWISLVI